jgi:rhamnulokinase
MGGTESARSAEGTQRERSPAVPKGPYLAIDLGASSGRAVLGTIAAGRLELTEIHRFANHAVRLKDTLYWDFLHLWSNVREALARCAGGGHTELASIGVDSWNLDFGLLDQAGTLLGNPISYRDEGAAWVGARVVERVPERELYEITGMPVFPITGLARLIQMQLGPARALLDLAHRYLPIPDLVRYFLSGEASVEQTIAWGTQLVDIRSRSWSRSLIDRFSVPERLLPPVIEPGTVAGTLDVSVAEATGLSPCPVVAVAEHDTASAAFVAGMLDPEAAVLSVGTWSILGALVDGPVRMAGASELRFMQELAWGGILVARNTMGFYVLEELQRCWRNRGIECSHATLVELARRAAPGALCLDLNDPLFFSPTNAEEALREHCRESGQEAGEDVGVIARGVYEGLAGSYAADIGQLQALVERPLRRIVLVGGGVRNRLFCQMVADACRLEVVAASAETTVVGNLCLQALALGGIQRGELPGLLRRSLPLESYRPRGEGGRGGRGGSRTSHGRRGGNQEGVSGQGASGQSGCR